ncbi:MAG TPA: hypothetical protein DEO44_03995, partial [Verrucomicrobia subdivision 6 bacterium]|nr:hypothetical protein [Verrucomicrobia subdivision 6 bacterium]
MLGITKGAIREEMRARVARLSEEERRAASQTMEMALLERPEWKQAPVVGLYLSLTDEPQTRGLLQMGLDAGKKVL